MTIYPNISIVAVDLDETIVRSTDWTISERTLEALRQWRVVRGPVVIATGRPPRWTRRIPEELHSLPWICYNGAVAYEDGEEVYRNMIAPDVVHRLVDFLQKEANGYRLALEIDDVLYSNQPIERRNDVQVVADLRTVAEQQAAKILMQMEPYRLYKTALETMAQGAVFLVSERVGMVQIMAPNTSKGTALQALVRRWGCSMQNVVSFGDDVNDVEMIRDSALGVAMSNAVSEVHDVADRVTLSNNEEGVAIVLEEMLGVSTNKEGAADDSNP